MTLPTERRDFVIGEEAALTRTFTQEQVALYAQVSGDDNPLHLDDTYAAQTRFGRPIAHGLLVSGLISAVLGTRLPGPGSIYLSQQLRFKAPVYPGETVTARVQITEWDPARGMVTLQTDVTNAEGTVVITGEARIIMAAFLRAA